MKVAIVLRSTEHQPVSTTIFDAWTGAWWAITHPIAHPIAQPAAQGHVVALARRAGHPSRPITFPNTYAFRPIAHPIAHLIGHGCTSTTNQPGRLAGSVGRAIGWDNQTGDHVWQ